MAIVWVDLGSGNDSNDGLTPTTPKLTLAAASTVAGAAGELRVMGQAPVDKGNATWTNGSTSVVFAADAGLAAGGGDFIYPAGGCPPYKTTAYDAATKTATLQVSFQLANGTYDTFLLQCYATTAAQTFSADDQTVSFGWYSDGTQPAGWITGIANSGGSDVITVTHDGTIIQAEGRLFLAVTATSGNCNCVRVNGNGIAGRVTGTLWAYYSRGNAGTLGADSYGLLTFDDLATAYGILYYYSGRLVGRSAVIHNSSNGGRGLLYGLYYGSLLVSSATFYNVGSTVLSGGYAGEVFIGHLTSVGGNISGFIIAGTVKIGYITSLGGSFSYNGAVAVGGPASLWTETGNWGGVVDKTIGRGGAGYCWRLTPGTSQAAPLEFVFPTLVDAGKAVTLNLYGYYTGSQPTVTLVLREPNGAGASDSEELLITLPATTWPGSPISIALGGSTTQKGSLQVALRVYNGSANDSVVYIDDVTWANAGDQADTSGLDYMGLVPVVQKVAAGGGLPFPLGI